MSNRERHGCAYDRGCADAYYDRPRRPHYFVGATYASEEVTEKDMTPGEIAEYNDGYDKHSDRKDWGWD